MNRNDCFVLLCSRLSKLHKTYISSLPCAILHLQRGKRKDGIETLESGIAVLKRRRSFLLFLFFSFQLQGSALVCSLFSLLEGTIEKDHLRGFWKNASAIKYKICYTAVWWKKWNKHCAKIVPCWNRKLYFQWQNSTMWSSPSPNETLL